jgi:hypothetical protein
MQVDVPCSRISVRSKNRRSTRTWSKEQPATTLIPRVMSSKKVIVSPRSRKLAQLTVPAMDLFNANQKSLH